ncbi:MAG TPA: pilin [Patescibacteria group bacterium]|nr:pilin [Patescibacteria group bacterium]
MNTIRIKIYKFVNFAAILLLVLGPVSLVQAQTAPVCDPWPTDTAAMLNCLDWYNNHQTGKTYAPGTNPADPSTFPLSGTWGLDASYSDIHNQLLVVASDSATGSSENVHIRGVMADPETLAPLGSAFQIDQASGMFRGTPKAIYNSAADKFLVAWEDERPTTNGRSTYARFVSGTGQPLGNEFVVSTSVALLAGVTFDPVNDKYLILRGFNHPEIDLVDENGKVDPKVIYFGSNDFQDIFSSVAVDTNNDEYLATYVALLSGSDTANEDDRVMLQRINAKTGELIGAPVQLSQTRVGRNAFSNSQIAYDPVDKTAVAVWMERGRDGSNGGIWGRNIQSDGSLGPEFPVMTINSGQTVTSSGGYGAPVLNYNPATNTFFLEAQDWEGGADLSELDYTGLVYDSNLTIAPACNDGNCGTYNAAVAVTGSGAVTLGSVNYDHIAATSHVGLGEVITKNPPANPPQTAGTIDLGPIRVSVSKVYTWSLSVAAILAVLMIIVGGYITMTSAGNADRASRGKKYITSAVVGLILLFGAYILLRTINPDLVNFGASSTPAQTTTQSK